MSKKRVCVVMSTYNGEKYLREQIESLESQTLLPERIHIRDDGSVDGTKDLIKRLAEEYDNITYDLCGNIGWRLGFIEALRQCGSYDLYAFCDQDDVWLPEKLESAVDLLEPKFNHDTPLLYAGNVTIADSNLKPIKLFNEKPVDILYKDFPHTLTMDEMAGGLTYVFNDAAKDLLLGFEYPGIAGHDRLLMLICKLYGEIVYDFNSYVLYRQHGNNAIGGIARPVARMSLSQMVRKALSPSGRQRGALARGLLAIEGEDRRLSDDIRKFLELCACCRTSPVARASLFFTSNIGAYSHSEEIKLRIRILLGSY